MGILPGLINHTKRARQTRKDSTTAHGKARKAVITSQGSRNAVASIIPLNSPFTPFSVLTLFIWYQKIPRWRVYPSQQSNCSQIHSSTLGRKQLSTLHSRLYSVITSNPIRFTQIPPDPMNKPPPTHWMLMLSIIPILQSVMPLELATHATDAVIRNALRSIISFTSTV
jgi:hypothetical protein